jgi:MFS family permease
MGNGVAVNSAEPPTASPRLVSFYAWAVVAMLFPVALLNYLDRTMVATMRTSIRADIPSIANDQDFGMLMALFMWVYALCSPVGGYLADRFNRTWIVISSLLIWSLMTWLTGFAHTFTEMAWARSLMGISEAFYIPTALALIADYHPSATRSRAVSIHMCGIYAGQALGGLGGYIADLGTWRNAFHWFGAAGVVYAVFLSLFLRENKNRPAIGSSETGANSSSFSKVIITLLSSGSFLILVVYATLPSMPGWVVKNWLPTYLNTTFNLKQGPAGMSATGYVTIALFFGALLSGFLADKAMKKTVRGRLYVTAAGMAFCTPALLGLGLASSIGWAILCMVLFGLGFGSFDANNMPILCQIVRPEHRATGYGLMNTASVAMGAVVTLLAGTLRDNDISLRTVFALSAVITLIAGIVVLQIRTNEPVARV